MQNAIRRRIKIALLTAALAGAIAPGPVLAQSGSAGGSIGNDEKSLPGTRSAEPERPARRSKPEAEEPRRSTSRKSGGGGGGGGNFDGAWVVNSVGSADAQDKCGWSQRIRQPQRRRQLRRQLWQH